MIEKTSNDFISSAEEIIKLIVNNIYIHKTENKLSINFDILKEKLAYCQLDAYNEGYDAAIVSQCSRKYKVD